MLYKFEFFQCTHFLAHTQVDTIKHKHTLLFVAEALTGSLRSLDKKRQITALKGKLRDGTIRGKRARLTARKEIEKLQNEIKAASRHEAASSTNFAKELTMNDRKKMDVSNEQESVSSLGLARELQDASDDNSSTTSEQERALNPVSSAESAENDDKRAVATAKALSSVWEFPSECDKSLSDVEVSCGLAEASDSEKSAITTVSMSPPASDHSPTEFESSSSTHSGEQNLHTQRVDYF